MSRTAARTAITVGAAALAAAIGTQPVQAKLLATSGNLEAHVADLGWCAPTIHVEVRSPDQTPFLGDMLALQRLLGLVRFALAHECPQATRLRIAGVVADAVTYSGTVGVADGAISSDPVPDPSIRMPTSRRDQVREVQDRLTALGFAPGPIDGVTGPQTFRAITEYQLSRGLPADGEVTVALVERLRAESRPPAPPPVADATGQQQPPGSFNSPGESFNAPGGNGGVAAAPGPFASTDGSGAAGVGGSAPLEGFPAFSRLLAEHVAATPGLADSDPFVAGFLAFLDGCEALGGLMNNEVGLPRYIAENRQRALDAMAQMPRPPFTLRFTASGRLTDFDFATSAFPMNLSRWRAAADGFAEEQVNHNAAFCRSGGYADHAVLGYIDDAFPAGFRLMFDPSAVPAAVTMSPDEAAAYLQGRSGYGSRNVEAEIVVGNVRPYPVGGTPNRPWFEGEVLSVTVTDSQDGATLLAIEAGPAPGPSPQPGASWPAVLNYASANEIMVVDGRLVADATIGDSVDGVTGKDAFHRMLRVDALRVATESGLDIPGGLNIGAIAEDYFSVQTRRELFYRTLGTLDEDQVRRLEAGRWLPDQRVLNEFQYPQVLAALEAQLPTLFTQYPRVESLPVLLLCNTDVGRYDFEAGAFPLSARCGGSTFDVSQRTLGRLGVIPELQELPATLPMPVEQASRLSELLESDYRGRRAVLAIEATIDGYEPGTYDHDDKSVLLAGVALQGLALYRDAALVDELYRWDAAAIGSDDVVDPSQVAPTGPLAFGEDTVRLLALRAGLMGTDERTRRQWLQSVAEAEEAGTSGWTLFQAGLPSHRIAREGSDALLARFDQWNAARVQALPGTMVLDTWSAEADHEKVRSWAAQGALPILPPLTNSSLGSNAQRELAEQLGVPASLIFGTTLSVHLDEEGWPAVAVRLPAAAERFEVPVAPGLVSAAQSVRAAAELRIEAVEQVTLNSGRRVIVVRASPTAGRVVDQDGEVLAEADFDVGAAEFEAIEYPPFTYFFDQIVRLGSVDPLELAQSLAPMRDSFEARDWAQTLLDEAAAMRPAYAGLDQVWLVGEARLGQYDFATGAFPITSLSMGPYRPSGDPREEQFRDLRFRFEGEAPQQVAMESDDAARAWQAGSPTFPDFAARYLVEPTAIQGNYLIVRLVRLELLDEDETLTVRDPDIVRYAWGDDPETAAASGAADGAVSRTPGAFDVVGVRTGLDPATAAGEVAAAMRSPQRFSKSPGGAPPAAEDRFHTGMLVVEADGSEAVVLYSEPPLAADQVTAIGRHLHFAEGEGPAFDQIRGALVDKYGAPAGETAAADGRAAFAWRQGGDSGSGLGLSPEQVAERRCGRQTEETLAQLDTAIRATTPIALFMTTETWINPIGGSYYSWRNGAGPVNPELLRELTAGRSPCADELFAAVWLSGTGQVTDLILFTYATRLLHEIAAAAGAGSADTQGAGGAVPQDAPEEPAEPGFRL